MPDKRLKETGDLRSNVAALQYQTKQLSRILELSQQLTSTLSLEPLLQQIIVGATELTSTEAASIMLYDAKASELHFAAATGANTTQLAQMTVPIEGSVAGEIFKAKRAMIVQADQDPRHYGRVDQAIDFHTRTILGVPLCIKDRCIGVVEVINKRDGVAFSEGDIQLLWALAAQAAIAIKNAALFQSEREQRQLAETMQRVTATLASTLDLDAILDLVLEQVGQLAPNDAANIMLLEGERVRAVRWRGYERWGATDFISYFDYPLKTLEGLARVSQTGQPLLITDTRAAAGWTHFDANEWIASFMTTPIRVRDKLLGFICMDSSTPGFFGPAHLERLRIFADQAAVALENARLYRAEREQFQQLQASQAQLAQVEKAAALGRLLGAIAHEINNPLQAIQGGLNLIEESLAPRAHPAELDRYLQITEQAVGRIAAIVRRVRDFDRPSSGSKQVLDVRPLLEQVLELADNQLKQNKVSVEQEWIGTVPPVWANADELKQVFMNLTLNAADAMQGRGGVLSVRAYASQMRDRETDQTRPAVQIEFSDTGEGIPAELLPQVFEPFVTTTPDKTALGLAISYRIIQAHGGDIRVTSRAGQGTTFTVLLPAHT